MSVEVAAIKRVAKIVRASRKQSGLTQTGLARFLDLDQSALSRVESGKQILTAPQFIKLAELTHISGECLQTGYIEFPRAATLEEGSLVADFRIPGAYANARGSKVRSALPFLDFFSETLGAAKLESYLESKDVDPDFLVNLDNQININFILDISRQLIGKGVLKPHVIPRLVKPVNQAHMHGSLHHFYDGIAAPEALLKALVGRAKHYECNFDYSIADASRKHLDLAIAPEKHMDEFDYQNDSALGDFLCQYKRQYFSRFTTYGGNIQGMKLKELECHYQGHSQCVYRLEVAA